MTNYAKNALASGWDRYTVEMTNTKTGKSTTKNCFRYGDLLCWDFTICTLVDDEWGNWVQLTNNHSDTVWSIDEMDYGHSKYLNGQPSPYDRYVRVTKGGPMSRFNSNKEMALYHYFNPNGAHNTHRQMFETLMQYVEAGHINSGWLIAHGEDYHTEKLLAAAQAKRTKSPWYHVETLLQRTEETYTAIAEVHMGLRDSANRPITNTK